MMFVLLLILLVLLIATGLLPGAMKLVSGTIGLLIALYIGTTFGWEKLGYIAAMFIAVAIAQIAYGSWKKRTDTKRQQREALERQRKTEQDRSARESARQSEKEAAIARQIAKTESIGKSL